MEAEDEDIYPEYEPSNEVRMKDGEEEGEEVEDEESDVKESRPSRRTAF